MRAAVCLLAILTLAGPAAADVTGPDDSLAQAYGPLRPGVDVPGAFTGSDDVDYLSFRTTAPDTAVHITVTNTTGSCTSPDGPSACAVWGTLIDAGQQQLGGDGSSAGTDEVDAGATDVIDWMIAVPGTYYLAMDSGGSLPSYTVRLDQPVAAAPAPAPVSGLAARSARHGTAVLVSFTAGRTLRSVTAVLALRTRGHRSATAGRGTLTDVPAGHATLTLNVGAAARRALARSGHHRVRLALRVTGVADGAPPAVFTRAVLLHR